MTKNVFILTLLTAICSCDFLTPESGQEKGFYETILDWDIKHIPIIPPFRASSVHPDKWLIRGSEEFINLGENRHESFEVASLVNNTVLSMPAISIYTVPFLIWQYPVGFIQIWLQTLSKQ